MRRGRGGNNSVERALSKTRAPGDRLRRHTTACRMSTSAAASRPRRRARSPAASGATRAASGTARAQDESPLLSVLPVGCKCWYGAPRRIVHVCAVHYDDSPPYYTINIDGQERSTVRNKLTELTPEEVATETASPENKHPRDAQRRRLFGRGCGREQIIWTCISMVGFAIGIPLLLRPCPNCAPAEPPPLPPGVSMPPWPLPSTRRPKLPQNYYDDDDDEILCDCAWTNISGQSCTQTKGKQDFQGCWASCCSQ